MPYVYAFEEGSKEQKYLLGGKGANLAEMTKLGLPVPPGFTITTDACKAYMAADDTHPRRPDGRGRRGAARARGEDGQAARRRRRPAARLGALRRAVLDAGDDGHRPQPRSQRRVGAAASPSRPATSASRTTRTAASCRCSARSCSTSPASGSRRRSHELREERGVAIDTELVGRRPRGSGRRRFKAIVLAEAGIDVPRRPQGAARATRSRRCSGPGTASAPATTAAWRRSPTTSAPRSTCRRWCSATRATTPAPASRSPATRRPARTGPTATS